MYNFIIDLGSWPERAFEPDDLRSVNNFNTRLPGTLQKYCSQSGVFRLALKYFPTGTRTSSGIAGGLRRRTVAIEGRTGYYVPTEPSTSASHFSNT